MSGTNDNKKKEMAEQKGDKEAKNLASQLKTKCQKIDVDMMCVLPIDFAINTK